MKKKTMLLPLLGIAGLTGATLLAHAAPVYAYDSTVWDSANALGEIDEDSYFGPCWSLNDIGSKRLDDRAAIITDHAEWGRRGQILKREFDLTSFYIEFDCSQLPSKTALMLCLGSEGLYASEPGKLVSMDIVRGEFDTTAYICTLSTTSSNSGHATSIPSFTDGGTWADDANFTGVQCYATDGVIRLSFKKDNDTTTTVKFNDVVTTVQNSELYENCVDSTKGHLSIGLINNAGPEMKYIIREFGDDETDIYYSEEGDFGKTKAECAAIQDLNAEGFDSDQIVALKERFDAIPYKNLYSYDKKWLAETYNSTAKKVNDIMEEAGAEISLSLFEKKVQAAVETSSSLDTVEGVKAGLKAYEAAVDALFEVDGDALDGGQTTRLNSASDTLQGFYTTLLTAMQTVYTSSVEAYEAEVAKTIGSAEDYLACTKLKANIPTEFNEYLSEDFTTPLATRINTADDTLKGKSTLNYANWKQGSGAHAIGKTGGIDLVTAGDAYGEIENTAGIYCTQAFDVLDFEFVINFSTFGGAPTGAWFTFGLMENCGMWIMASDMSIQDNKGVFFLATKLNSETVNLQCFICTMVCNTFYDSVINQNIQVPMGKDITVKFSGVEKTIAGVTDTYFNMDFGGTSYDEEVIKTRTLKTVFGTGLKGYFFINSGSMPASNPGVVKLGTINGKDPSSSDLSKEGTSTGDNAPTTTTTSAVEFASGSTNTASFNFDSKGKTITAVKVDGKAISSGDYTYADNTLTLTNDFLSTLSAGSHSVEASTSEGSCTWTLNVTAGGSSSGGCGGSVIASSALISLIAVAGVCLLGKKKKEDK